MTGNTAPLTVGAASDPGIVHDENEDAFGHFSAEPGTEQLFVVADGMGGHVRGGEASRTAVAVVKETFFDNADTSVPDRLRDAFHRANDRVFRLAEAEGGIGSMGTTVTALALVDGQAYLAHVGDSRAYRIRAGEIEQLTRDHTLVQEMRREGTLTEEEARTHPRRGTLTRAVGASPTVEVDLIEVGAPEADDRFLLCSDGLEELPHEVLREVVRGKAPQAACEDLVRRANERGGYDNATALVIHVTGAE